MYFRVRQHFASEFGNSKDVTGHLGMHMFGHEKCAGPAVTHLPVGPLRSVSAVPNASEPVTVSLERGHMGMMEQAVPRSEAVGSSRR